MSGIGIVGDYVAKKLGSQRVKQLVMTDASQAMLQASTSKAEKVAGLAQTTIFQPKSFDVILCRAGLNNLEKDLYPDVLDKIIKTLDTDGILVVQDHFPLTASQKLAINALEQHISKEDGRNDTPYVPAIHEIEELLVAHQGKVLHKTTESIRVPLTRRLQAKKYTKEQVERTLAVAMQYSTELLPENTKDQISIIYPISTLVIGKEST